MQLVRASSSLVLALVLCVVVSTSTAVVTKKHLRPNHQYTSTPAVLSEDGTSIVTPAQYAGYVTTNTTRNHRLWYWMFESTGNVTSDPVVLWMQGGPGASGSIGLFYENGPFHVNTSLQLTPNPWSWTNRATVIYIDQPIGTGWAESPDHPLDELDLNERVMMSEVLTLLDTIFTDLPQYSIQPFYIFGESYGGHYIPSLAHVILTSSPPSPLVSRLTGLGIGDGWIDPLIQYQAYIDFSLQNGLLTPREADDLQLIYNLCATRISAKEWVEAGAVCNLIVAGIFALNPGLNFYDIRNSSRCPEPLQHDCYNFQPSIDYMSQSSVRPTIGVAPTAVWRDPEVPFSVVAAINGDEEMSYDQIIPQVLSAGIRVLCYNGEYDFAANYVGGEAWLQALSWPGQSAFNNQTLATWMVKGVPAGLIKSEAGLTQLRVYDAGHMLPMNTPMVAYVMFDSFIKGEI